MLGPGGYIKYLSCLLEEESIETWCFKHFVRAHGAPCHENAHKEGWMIKHKRVLQGTSCETVVQYINGIYTVWQNISSITLSIFLHPWTRQVDQRYFTTGRRKHGCFGLVSGSTVDPTVSPVNDHSWGDDGRVHDNLQDFEERIETLGDGSLLPAFMIRWAVGNC